MYVYSLNYYRLATHSPLPEVIDVTMNPPPPELLVLNTFDNRDVLARKDLTILYRWPSTNMVIAATPDFQYDATTGECPASGKS